MEEHKKFGATDILMLLAILLWAINFSFIKIALREFTPLAFNGIRLLLSSLILIFFLFVSGEDLSVDRSDILKLLIIAISGNTIYQMLFIHGINLTTASNSSIIIAMGPVFIALLSFLLKHEKLHWAAWFGIFTSFVGFYLVIAKQVGAFQLSQKELTGDLMIFFGNLFWAVYTVFSKPLLERISPLKLTSLSMVIGTVFYIPFCVKDIINTHYNEVSFKAWGALFYSGLFALVICYIIWFASVKRVGSSRTAIYDNLVPVFAVIFAYLFLNEKITILQACGVLIIFIGVYLTRVGYRWFDKRETDKNDE